MIVHGRARAGSTFQSMASANCFRASARPGAGPHPRVADRRRRDGGRPLVVGGDVAVWFDELDEPQTEGQLRGRALEPELVWLAHEHEPWRPRHAA